MGLFSKIFGGDSHEKLATIVNEGAFLVDVRSKGELVNGTVKGAVNIPLDQMQSQLTQFKDKKNIVVFCRSGNRSSQAKSILEQNGFTNVTNGGTWREVNAVIFK